MTTHGAAAMITTTKRTRRAHRARAQRATLAATAVLASVVLVSGLAAPAGAAEQVTGSGSTWSAIAVLQWAADVARQGVSVNFTPNGSSTGRKFYIQNQSDFAVSEIPFQKASRDREGQIIYDELELARERPYAYLPIVAGGTSFMYQLVVNGQRVTNLRLSGATVAKIFTGVITNWNDPAITADNGRAFPSKAIKPVVRSDGSGTSAQFSTYLNEVHNGTWKAFCAKTKLTPCEPTSLYPYFAGSQAQAGSDGVASAVAAPYNDGAITYVEYGYAKQRGFPVASVRNQAGYFVQPTAGNVAVALTRARIKSDRTQILSDVYRNPDRRTYPVSSYSYMIVPTSTAGRFTEQKGATLGQFILYFLCTGQQKAEQLGYSPLPKVLVQFGFDAVRGIPGAPAPPAIERCANPTITGAFSPERAPAPPPDAAPNARAAGPGGSAGGANPGRIGGTNSGDGGGPDAGGASTTVPNGKSTEKNGTGTTAPTDESTGQVDGTGAAGSSEQASAAELAAATAATSRGQETVSTAFYGVTVVVVLLALFGPPALGAALRRREREP